MNDREDIKKDDEKELEPTHDIRFDESETFLTIDMLEELNKKKNS